VEEGLNAALRQVKNSRGQEFRSSFWFSGGSRPRRRPPCRQ